MPAVGQELWKAVVAACRAWSPPPARLPKRGCGIAGWRWPAQTRWCRPRSTFRRDWRRSASVCGDPPPMSIRFSLPSAKNPTDRLSGDQNGYSRLRSRPAAAPMSRPAAAATAVLPVARGHKHDLPPIGGKRKGHRVAGGRSDDLGAHLRRYGRRFAEMHKDSAASASRSDGGHSRAIKPNSC